MGRAVPLLVPASGPWEPVPCKPSLQGCHPSHCLPLSLSACHARPAWSHLGLLCPSEKANYTDGVSRDTFRLQNFLMRSLCPQTMLNWCLLLVHTSKGRTVSVCQMAAFWLEFIPFHGRP